MADQILSKSAYTTVINVPIDWIDIADRPLNVPEAEYQRCAPPDGATLEQAAAVRQAASSDHNSWETPSFAKSIERKALAKHRD